MIKPSYYVSIKTKNLTLMLEYETHKALFGYQLLGAETLVFSSLYSHILPFKICPSRSSSLLP